MTTIFLEINNDFHLLEHLTYNSETKVFTVFTERVGDWKNYFQVSRRVRALFFY